MKNEKQISRLIVNLQKKIYGGSYQIRRHDLKNYVFADEDEQRITYYLGDISKNRVTVNKNNTVFQSDSRFFNLSIMSYEDLVQATINRSIPVGYCLPIINIFNLLNDTYKKQKIVCAYGDSSRHIKTGGVIAKTRFSDNSSISLLKLKPKRHWSNVRCVALYDGDYRQKKSMAVWRGATTGNNKKISTRRELVKQYYSHKDFNIGFSHLSKNNVGKKYENLVKGQMTLEDQLQYKCLICVEGNDVASGLKWMLNSQSVVMMTKPTVCSWLMEEHLQPFVHYIPLEDDFIDLEEKFEWAMQNEEACLEIINNAFQFMKPFLDFRRELMIECEVMKRYLCNIEIR